MALNPGPTQALIPWRRREGALSSGERNWLWGQASDFSFRLPTGLGLPGIAFLRPGHSQSCVRAHTQVPQTHEYLTHEYLNTQLTL